jgi:hypothetical protein
VRGGYASMFFACTFSPSCIFSLHFPMKKEIVMMMTKSFTGIHVRMEDKTGKMNHSTIRNDERKQQRVKEIDIDWRCQCSSSYLQEVAA